MGLTMKQSTAINALARAVQNFLPGSGSGAWKGHVTFGTVADRAGVGEHWAASGSKVPRLTQLFEKTLLLQPQNFERLIVGIVKEGLRYRSGASRIEPEEIKLINGHILDIGFRFPDLWDDGFLRALEVDDVARATNNVAAAERDAATRSTARERQIRALDGLKVELETMFGLSNRQEAGFALERLLNSLFGLFDLTPRAPFKVIGEQIDGSFELDHELYLLEAKWEREAMREKELLVFRGKIEGKSSFTRGVFVAMNGITPEADAAIRIGKQPTFFVVNGHDLMMVVQGSLALPDFLRRRRRLLAEEAAVTAAFARVQGVT